MTTRAPIRFVLLAALAAGCGDSLHDARGVPLDEGGGALACAEDQTSCGGVCTTEDAAHCGSACEECTGTPPEGGALACVGGEGKPLGTCGFECPGGLRCEGGCCGATAVAAGPAFTCALATDGTVHCFGSNGSGELGDGGGAPRLRPRAVDGVEDAVSIGAGRAHACAVRANGAVTCWGANAHGQVTGDASSGPVTASATPVTAGAIAVAGAERFTCALLGSGAVRCWGDPARIGDGTPLDAGATAIAAGRDHACALLAGGAVRCWGSNANGQLGVVSELATEATPIASGIARIAAFAGQTCAATGASTGEDLDDALRCWGDSVGAAYGFAGPQRTPAIPLRDHDRATIDSAVTLAAAGAHHVCVGKADTGGGHELECLGANEAFQLGGPVEPGHEVPVLLPAPALAIAAGDAHTCAALVDGRLRCWGANGDGQLGRGDTAPATVGELVAPTGR